MEARPNSVVALQYTNFAFAGPHSETKLLAFVDEFTEAYKKTQKDPLPAHSWSIIIHSYNKSCPWRQTSMMKFITTFTKLRFNGQQWSLSSFMQLRPKLPKTNSLLYWKNPNITVSTKFSKFTGWMWSNVSVLCQTNTNTNTNRPLLMVIASQTPDLRSRR